MSSRDAGRFAPISSETEQSGSAVRAHVRQEVRAIGQATKNIVNGNIDAQVRCDAGVSETMRRISATRDAIERSRRRLAEHTFYIA